MGRNEGKDRNGRPVLEWIVGVTSAIVVCAIVAFLAYEALFGDMRPPDLAATIDRVEEVGDGTLVVIAVSNRGDQAAAEVVVEATLEGGDPEASGKEVRFDYVASHAVRRGAFVIEGQAVKGGDVRLQVHGYAEP
ncbi:MAG: hypothetical protein K5872_14845 [Rhizobiaceae bacterium]|nr:hypothetical protein [Rhizobiaceae bacterium]MCV0407499.1 hypothetical protein [Rhizobiaceae bacterium]